MSSSRSELIDCEKWMRINPAIGIVETNGEYQELIQFWENMKSHHIGSFDGRFTICTLKEPLPVFGTGHVDKPGKYWTIHTPQSPMQNTIDMAISSNFYADRFTPGWRHPSNNSVLMLEIPTGHPIAYGRVARQGKLLGGGTQVFYPALDPAAKIRCASWAEWSAMGRSPLAYAKNWEEITINGIRFYVENEAARKSMETMIPSIFNSSADNIQSLLQLAKIKSSTSACYAMDVTYPEYGFPATTYHFKDSNKILLPAKNTRYYLFPHELSHSTLPLAGPNASTSQYSEAYRLRLYQALINDCGNYNKIYPYLSEAEKSIGRSIFYAPRCYPIENQLAEYIAYTVQCNYINEIATNKVAEQFNTVLKQYIYDVTREAEHGLAKSGSVTIAGFNQSHCLDAYLQVPNLPSRMQPLHKFFKGLGNAAKSGAKILLFDAVVQVTLEGIQTDEPDYFRRGLGNTLSNIPHYIPSTLFPISTMLIHMGETPETLELEAKTIEKRKAFLWDETNGGEFSLQDSLMINAQLMRLAQPLVKWADRVSNSWKEERLKVFYKPLEDAVTPAEKATIKILNFIGQNIRKYCYAVYDGYLRGVYGDIWADTLYHHLLSHPTVPSSNESVAKSFLLTYPCQSLEPSMKQIVLWYSLDNLNPFNWISPKNTHPNISTSLSSASSLFQRYSHNFGDGLLKVPSYTPPSTPAAKKLGTIADVLTISASYGAGEFAVLLKLSMMTGFWIGLGALALFQIGLSIKENKDEKKFLARQRALNKVIAECQTVDQAMQEVYDSTQAAYEAYNDYMTAPSSASFLKADAMCKSAMEKTKSLSNDYQSRLDNKENLGKRTRDYLSNRIIPSLNTNVQALEKIASSLNREEEIVESVRSNLNQNALSFNIKNIYQLLDRYESYYPERVCEINELRELTKLAEKDKHQSLSYWQEENKKLNQSTNEKITPTPIDSKSPLPVQKINQLGVLSILESAGYKFYNKSDGKELSQNDTAFFLDNAKQVEMRIPDTGIKHFISSDEPLTSKVFFNALFRSSVNFQIKLYVFSDKKRQNQLVNQNELKKHLNQGGCIEGKMELEDKEGHVGYKFWFNKDSVYIKSDTTCLSVEKSHHDYEYVSFFRRMLIVNRQQEIAGELEKLGYIKKASRAYQYLIENNHEAKLKPEWEKAASYLIYSFNNQLINMLSSPCRNILERHLRGYADNKRSRLAYQGFSILSIVESLLPFTFSSFMLQTLTELSRNNFTDFYENYIKRSFEKLMKDEWQFILPVTRMGLQILRLPFEEYLNFSENYQHKIKYYRENGYYYGSKILEYYTIYNAVTQLKMTKATSADAPRHFLTIFEFLLHNLLPFLESKNENLRLSSKSSLYYRSLHASEVALRGMCEVLYWDRMDDVGEDKIVHATHLLLNVVNAAHSYFAASSISEAEQKVLANCMLNINHCEKLYNTETDKKKSNPYFIAIKKNLTTITDILENSFGGLHYQCFQSSIVNEARLFNLFHKVRQLFINLEYKKAMALIESHTDLINSKVNIELSNELRKLTEKLVCTNLKMTYLKFHRNNDYSGMLYILQEHPDIYNDLFTEEKISLILILDQLSKNEEIAIKKTCVTLLDKFLQPNNHETECDENDKGKEVINNDYTARIIDSIQFLIEAKVEINDQLLEAIVKYSSQAMYIAAGIKIITYNSLTCLSQETALMLMIKSGKGAENVANSLVKLYHSSWGIPLFSLTQSEDCFLNAFFKQSIIANDVMGVKGCLEIGENPNYFLYNVNGKDDRPLTLAARLGHTELASILLSHGAKVKYNKNALKYAAQAGNIEMLKLLLKAGANPNSPPILYGLHLAHNRRNFYEITRILISNGAYCSDIFSMKTFEDYKSKKAIYLIYLTSLFVEDVNASKQEQVLYLLNLHYKSLPLFAFFGHDRRSIIREIINRVLSENNDEKLLSIIVPLKETDKDLFNFIKEMILIESMPAEIQSFIEHRKNLKTSEATYQEFGNRNLLRR